tara:strand:- start:1379 stop:1552 length:174 start_codon:yes stop_codon:yes gene_type:complete
LAKNKRLVILMMDKLIYNFLGFIDTLFSKIETVAISLSTWLWSKRAKILRKKRGMKK